MEKIQETKKEGIDDKENAIQIKGFMALIVMLGHILSNMKYIYFILSGGIAVGIFFYYSSFGTALLSKKENYFDNFVKKKFIKIYIPFLIANNIYFISNIFLNKDLEKIHLKTILFQLIGIKLSNSVFWYVWHLIIFLLIFYLFRDLKKQQRLLIFIFMYLIYLILAVKFDIGTWWYTATSCILIGIYFADEDILKIGVSKKKIDFNFIVIIWLSILVVGELFIIKNIKLLAINDNYYNVGLQMMIIPLFLLAIKKIFYKRKLKIKILKFLGIISYEIYLYHMNIWILVQYFFEEKNYYFRIFIAIITTIIVAYFIKKITNKILSKYFI